MNTKEIKELLEKYVESHHANCSLCDRNNLVIKDILALLKEDEPCPTSNEDEPKEYRCIDCNTLYNLCTHNGKRICFTCMEKRHKDGKSCPDCQQKPESELQHQRKQFLNMIHNLFIKYINTPNNSYLISMTCADQIEDICGAYSQVICDRLEAAEKRIKQLEAPIKSANFNVDGMLAVGQELINLKQANAKLKESLEAAEKYIELSPCDPDITEEQYEAYKKWQALKDGT